MKKSKYHDAGYLAGQHRKKRFSKALGNSKISGYRQLDTAFYSRNQLIFLGLVVLALLIGGYYIFF